MQCLKGGAVSLQRDVEALLKDATNEEIEQALSSFLRGRGLELRQKQGSGTQGGQDGAVARAAELEQTLGSDRGALLEAEEEAQRDILIELEKTKEFTSINVAHLFPNAKAEDGPRSSTASYVNQARLDKLLFAMGTFYAMEGEPTIQLRVMRSGACNGTCSVRFTTHNVTALAGVNFESNEGVLEFPDGKPWLDIEIKLLQNSEWNPTREFKVELSEGQGCRLASHLKTCRVKLLDDDCFPTNRYKKELRRLPRDGSLPDNVGNDDGQVSYWLVIIEYFKMNLRNAVVLRGSIKCLLANLIIDLGSILTMLLNMQLIDRVLDTETAVDGTDQRLLLLIVIALALLLPSGVNHFLDYRRNYWKVGGVSRAQLQSALLGRYLTYESGSRSLVNETFLVTTTTQNVSILVNDGFMQVFAIVSSITELILVSCVQLGVAAIGIIPMCIFPVLIIAFLYHRTDKTAEYLEASESAEKELTDHLSRTAANFDLIRDFSQRGIQVERFQHTIKVFNRAVKRAGALTANNKYFCIWLSKVLVSIWIMVGGYHLIHRDRTSLSWLGEATLGSFLLTVQVFNTLGRSFGVMYQAILSIESTFPCLKNIVALMNLPVEEERCLEISRQKLSTTEDVWHQLQRYQKEGFPELMVAHFESRGISATLDMMPAIQAKNLSVFPIGEEIIDVPNSVMQAGLTFEVLQGSLAVFMGKSRTGKATLLKALAQAEQPAAGEIFTPPHLCVLHVRPTALFFKSRNLYQNMCLGTHRESDASPERVGAILKRLRLADEIVEQAQDTSGTSGFWRHRGLSVRQQALLNLGRALIANAEILILHTPLEHFGELDRKNVMQTLRDFVEERGLCQDPAGFAHRHPRTCIMSTRFGNTQELRSKAIRRMLLLDGKKDKALMKDIEHDIAVHSNLIE